MTQPNLAQAGNTSSISEAQQATQDADSQSAQAANENAETTTSNTEAGSETQPAATTGGDNDGETVDFQKKWEEAQKHIKTLNAENAKHRNAAKTAKEAQDELKQQVLQAFGDEQAQSPEDALKAAQEQAAQAHAELQQYKENDLLNRLVKKANGNPDVVIPYLRGSGNLPDFGTDDYASQVEQIIEDTLGNQPGLRARVAPTSSGQPLTPPGNDARLTRADLQGMSAKDIREARRAGKLDHLF